VLVHRGAIARSGSSVQELWETMNPNANDGPTAGGRRDWQMISLWRRILKEEIALHPARRSTSPPSLPRSMDIAFDRLIFCG
jgi:hypothetical protein